MPAPLKQELDFFPHDTDLSRDPKIEYIEALHGLQGYAVYLKLLEKIYRNSYYILWEDRDLIIFSKHTGIDKEDCQKVVFSCINEGLFKKKLFEKYNILTSFGIQKRYLKSCARRKDITFFKELFLLSDRDIKSILGENMKVNVNIVPINVNIYPQIEIEIEIESKKKKTTRARARVSWILSLAKEIVNEYPRIGTESSSISSVYNLLTLMNDKVGQYPELYIQAESCEKINPIAAINSKCPEEAKKAENIVKERAYLLRRRTQNYIKHLRIDGTEPKYIIMSHNFWGKDARWREFGEEPKPPPPKKPIHHDGQRIEKIPEQEQETIFHNQYTDFLEQRIPLSQEEILSDREYGEEVSGLIKDSKDPAFWFRSFGFQIRKRMLNERGLPTFEQWKVQHLQESA